MTQSCRGSGGKQCCREGSGGRNSCAEEKCYVKWRDTNVRWQNVWLCLSNIQSDLKHLVKQSDRHCTSISQSQSTIFTEFRDIFAMTSRHFQKMFKRQRDFSHPSNCSSSEPENPPVRNDDLREDLQSKEHILWHHSKFFQRNMCLLQKWFPQRNERHFSEFDVTKFRVITHLNILFNSSPNFFFVLHDDISLRARMCSSCVAQRE